VFRGEARGPDPQVAVATTMIASAIRVDGNQAMTTDGGIRPKGTPAMMIGRTRANGTTTGEMIRIVIRLATAGGAPSLPPPPNRVVFLNVTDISMYGV